MLAPASPRRSTAIVHNCEEGADQPINFHGWWITLLPDNALATIAQYLSMQDVDNLGSVCTSLDSSLTVCGLHDIRHYLSLSDREQRFYRQMTTGNHQLTGQLRKKRQQLLPKYPFPVQFSPALCIPFIHTQRRQLISSTAISLKPRGSVVTTIFDHHDSYYESKTLNKNHNCLILENRYRGELTYWKADINGFWSSDHQFRYNTGDVGYLEIDPDLQFFNCSDSGACPRGKQRVDLTVADLPGRLSLNLSGISIFRLSDDRKTLVYLQPHNAVIYDLDNNDKWRCTGRFTSVRDVLFSPDGRHIVLKRAQQACFLRKTADGSWISSGNINYVKPENHTPVREVNQTVVFCPNSSYVLLKCKYLRHELRLGSRQVVNVTIGGTDSDGQWFTQNVINKIVSAKNYYKLSNTRFTQDGKHLIVAGETGFDAWSLSKDGQWIETVKNRCYADRPDPSMRGDFLTILSMDGASLMIDRSNCIMIWAVDSDGLWSCQLQVPSTVAFVAQISPDGNCLVCPDESGQTAIWLRDPGNNWQRQSAQLPRLRMARFNDQSCLLAGVAVESTEGAIVLLGLTPQQIWQEKCRLMVKSWISELSFSPCGRSMLVDSRTGNKQTTAFWQIEPDKDNAL